MIPLHSTICRACRLARTRLPGPTIGSVPCISRPCSPRAAPWRALSTAAGTPNNRVKLVEVGPRDGLQNEKTVIPPETKADLIRRLAQTGLRTIEAGSFVRPEWVPQMADSVDVLGRILTSPPPSPSHQTSYSFLVPNETGLKALRKALAARPDSYSSESRPDARLPAIEVAVFAAATESFSQKNLNCSIDTSLERFKPVIRDAKGAGLRVRAYLSVVLGCPFEGPEVNPHEVARLATELLGAGADEVSLGDTTGMGTVPRTAALLKCMRDAGVRPEDVAMHFHNTYGQALVNMAVSLEHGIRTFDCSVAGLGGCPYSPGATGNVATEDVVYFLETLGMDTGVDLDRLSDVGDWVSGVLERDNASVVGKAVLGARLRAGQEKEREAK